MRHPADHPYYEYHESYESLCVPLHEDSMLDADEGEHADCYACGKDVPLSSAALYDGEYYHWRCLTPEQSAVATAALED